MPLEGKEAQLPDFDAGLPSTIDVGAKAEAFSPARPPDSVVAVYLRADGERFHPVLVTGRAARSRCGTSPSVWTTDASGNRPRRSARGPSAGAAGMPCSRNATTCCDSTRRPVTRSTTPCPRSTSSGPAGQPTALTIVARAGRPRLDHRRLGRPVPRRSRPTPRTRASSGWLPPRTPGRCGSDATTRRGRWPASAPSPRRPPSVWQDTLSTEEWAATGAFFDQNLTSAVIRRGNGPIYQGLVAVEGERGKASLLLAPENPDGQTGRFKGCCTVLGWADAQTVLFQSVGSHGALDPGLEDDHRRGVRGRADQHGGAGRPAHPGRPQRRLRY